MQVWKYVIIQLLPLFIYNNKINWYLQLLMRFPHTMWMYRQSLIRKEYCVCTSKCTFRRKLTTKHKVIEPTYMCHTNSQLFWMHTFIIATYVLSVQRQTIRWVLFTSTNAMINLTAYITVNTANNPMDRTTTYVGPISLIHTYRSVITNNKHIQKDIKWIFQQNGCNSSFLQQWSSQKCSPPPIILNNIH